MKNIFKYMILLCFVVSCSSTKNSQKVEISNIKFNLPKEAKKITREEITSNSLIKQKLTDLNNMDFIYKINDIYFASPVPYKGEVKKDLISSLKKYYENSNIDHELKTDFIYQTDLSKINQNDTFHVYFFHDNIGQYSFRIINKNYSQLVSGVIFFENQSNYQEATKMLNDFLKSVKFE